MPANRMGDWKKRDVWACEPDQLDTIVQQFNLRWGDLQGVEELAQSIGSQGQLQPGVVRLNSAGQVELVAGNRRLAAIRLINSDPAKYGAAGPMPFLATRRNLTEDQALEANLRENADRSALSPVDRAYAAQRLVNLGWSHDRIASAMGYAGGSRVVQLLSLLSLPHEALVAIHDGKMTEAGARALIGVPVAQVRELAGEVNRGETKPREAVARAVETKRAAGKKVGRTLAEVKAMLERFDSPPAYLLLDWIKGEAGVTESDLRAVFSPDTVLAKDELAAAETESANGVALPS